MEVSYQWKCHLSVLTRHLPSCLLIGSGWHRARLAIPTPNGAYSHKNTFFISPVTKRVSCGCREGVEKFLKVRIKIHNCLQGNEPWTSKLSSKLRLYGLFLLAITVTEGCWRCYYIIVTWRLFKLKEKKRKGYSSLGLKMSSWNSKVKNKQKKKCLESHEYLHASCALLLQQFNCN